jgi:cysteinyl-tRNA synthetase
MEDYFGYDVHLVMNITDIDDKVRSICICKLST